MQKHNLKCDSGVECHVFKPILFTKPTKTNIALCGRPITTHVYVLMKREERMCLKKAKGKEEKRQRKRR